MREAFHLRRRYRAVLAYVGLVVAIVGLVLLAPLLTILFWPLGGRAAAAFLLPGLILVAGGGILWRRLETEEADLSLAEGGVVVLASWIAAALAGAVPLMAIERLNFTQAVFESVSGWTTTGLSVIDVTRAHPAVLLWRSTMQLVGGAGLAIVMLAAMLGPGGLPLSAAEGRADQLLPNVRASAHLVLRIYAGYAIAGVLALRLAGLDWFAAVNHSFAAVSTGGFSTRPESIGAWDSPAVEAAVIVLMLLGALNFVTAWCLLRGKLRAVLGNGEIKVVAVLLPLCSALLLWQTCAPLYGAGGKAVRVAIFETATALTTTGFSTVGYGEWNAFGWLLLLVLMLIGGGTCSTAGALKQARVYLLFRSFLRELRRPFLPRRAFTDDSIWQGEGRLPVTDAQLRAVGTFVFLYLATWLIGAAILTAHGHGLRESLFEFASALGTVGLSAGVSRPDAPPLVLWTLTAGMLLGRLEFFVIFASVAKVARDAFWMARPGAIVDRPRTLHDRKP